MMKLLELVAIACIISCASTRKCMLLINMGRRGRDRMVVGLTTIYAISVYHH
jgi:hypothetical protein